MLFEFVLVPETCTPALPCLEVLISRDDFWEIDVILLSVLRPFATTNMSPRIVLGELCCHNAICWRTGKSVNGPSGSISLMTGASDNSKAGSITLSVKESASGVGSGNIVLMAGSSTAGI